MLKNTGGFMTADSRNFIYAYDDDEHQIIIIDAESGERIGKKPNRVQPVIQHLEDSGAHTKLRKFAVWCAYKCNKSIKPIQRKFLELAEQAIQGDADAEALENLYTESETEAVSVDTIGLRQGSAKAPGFLASRECVNPDAFEGAKNAARFHCLWAEMNQNDGKELPAGLEYIEQKPGQSIFEQTEQAQIDYLLELIGG